MAIIMYIVGFVLGYVLGFRDCKLEMLKIIDKYLKKEESKK